MEMLEKTSKTISTIAILWPVKAIFEKRAATVEVDTLIFPVNWGFYEFAFLRTDRISLRAMPIKPHEWPFEVQTWAFWAFKARSLRG